MSEKIEGTILIADGSEGKDKSNGRFAAICFTDALGDFVEVGWDGMIQYASAADRYWVAGSGTTLRSRK